MNYEKPSLPLLRYTSLPCEEDIIEVNLRRIMVVREVQQALIDANI